MRLQHASLRMGRNCEPRQDILYVPDGKNAMIKDKVPEKIGYSQWLTCNTALGFRTRAMGSGQETHSRRWMNWPTSAMQKNI